MSQVLDKLTRMVGKKIWKEVFSQRAGFQDLMDTVSQENQDEIYLKLGQVICDMLEDGEKSE